MNRIWCQNAIETKQTKSKFSLLGNICYLVIVNYCKSLWLQIIAFYINRLKLQVFRVKFQSQTASVKNTKISEFQLPHCCPLLAALSQSDVCLGHTTMVSRSAASSARLERSRSVKVSWPVTFALEQTAMAHQGPATSHHVQVISLNR